MSEPKSNEEAMAEFLYDFCREYLEENELYYEKNPISVAKIQEAANFCNRDLNRIKLDLNDSISRQKFAAYHAFWLARSQPVSNIFLNADLTNEAIDVNERIAAKLSFALVLDAAFSNEEDISPLTESQAIEATGFTDEPVPVVWRNCKEICAGICFEKAIQNYCRFHNWQNFEYIVHGLRHRATGPYNLVNVLEAITTTACKSISQDTHPMLVS